MAEHNRNREDSWRHQYNDWNDEYDRQHRSYEDEPNYTISENRGYRGGGRYPGMSSGDSGWQSRYERQMNTGREGDFDNDYRQRQYGRRDSDYHWGSSGYSDFGGDYSRRSRDLYDGGYEGMGRRDYQNRENRLGGANYDRYGDRGQYGYRSGRSNSGFGNTDYEGMNYGRGYGRPDWDRGSWHERDRSDWRRRSYGHGEPEERSWWDRTTDEVSSWFGDEDAERRRERDRELRGMYRGKGPRNYSRSDERIQEDINDRLSDDPFVDASEIDVQVSNGDVVLTGTVDHRSSKRRAEDIAEAVSGVKNVENRLRVAQYPYAGREMATETTRESSSAAGGTSAVPGSDRSRSETSDTSKS